MNEVSVERKNEHFKENPLSVYADQLMQHTALNEFISSTGETLDDCTKIIQLFEKAYTTSIWDFEEYFLKTMGFEFCALERYEDMAVEVLISSVLELYSALKRTVYRILCDREISVN